MKTLTLFCFLIINSSQLFSQNTDSTRLLVLEMIDILSKNATYKDKISTVFLTEKMDSILIAKKDSLRKVPYIFINYLLLID